MIIESAIDGAMMEWMIISELMMLMTVVKDLKSSNRGCVFYSY